MIGTAVTSFIRMRKRAQRAVSTMPKVMERVSGRARTQTQQSDPKEWVFNPNALSLESKGHHTLDSQGSWLLSGSNFFPVMDHRSTPMKTEMTLASREIILEPLVTDLLCRWKKYSKIGPKGISRNSLPCAPQELHRAPQMPRTEQGVCPPPLPWPPQS